MKFKRRIFRKNKNAVSHPLEFIISFGVLMLVFFFVFSSLNDLFAQHQTDNFVLRAKAMTIAERLIKDVGSATIPGDLEVPFWEFYLDEITSLGLASNILKSLW